MVGNTFVVLAVVTNSSMRNITNYFIANLAIADLLIMLLCLPSTLMNNTLWRALSKKKEQNVIMFPRRMATGRHGVSFLHLGECRNDWREYLHVGCCHC